MSVPEYEKVATFYDFLMRHVQYRPWFEYVHEILERRVDEPGEVLEIACGSGRVLEMFCERGWQVWGMDRSRPMLNLAQKRLGTFGNQAKLWCGDMRNFSVRENFNAIICLYDSINYCLNESDFIAALRNAGQALKRGGVFIFDVCTIWNCRENFRNYSENDEVDGIEFERHTYFNAATGFQYNDFSIQINDAPYFERHVQKMYPLDEVRRMIHAAEGWRILGAYTDFTKRPGKENAHRVHFVLRKR